MIIAIDFDGTIAEMKWPGIGEPIPMALETIRELYTAGNTLILWTCREGKHLMAARLWLNENKVGDCFIAFNENDPEAVSRHNTDPRKIGFNWVIDDKGIGMPLRGNNVDWTAVREILKAKGIL